MPQADEPFPASPQPKGSMLPQRPASPNTNTLEATLLRAVQLCQARWPERIAAFYSSAARMHSLGRPNSCLLGHARVMCWLHLPAAA